MNFYLFAGLEAGPTILHRLMERMTPAQWDVTLTEGRFTPREVIAHLADWELILRQRIQTIISTPGVTLEAYDEGEMAITNDYAHSDVGEQSARFAAERSATVAFLRTLRPDDWNLVGLHPERGSLSAGDQANMLLGHDLYHIEQLSAYL